MGRYTTSALVAFLLITMGIIAAISGIYNYRGNKSSKSGRQMLLVTLCVFGWDFGYAWMSLCYGDDFAYAARAIALLSVTFYMFFTLRYVGTVTMYSAKKLNIFLTVFIIFSLGAWVEIIQKDAVSFVSTWWGYWYNSRMSIARLVQFASIIAALVEYYFIIAFGLKNAITKRRRYILKQFIWFGPILFVGYILDTLLPTFFGIPAVPGSSISAFFSAMILFKISQKNKVFGLSKENVSEYVFEDVNVPVIITDRDGIINLYNDYSKKYLSCSDSGLEDKTMSDFFRMDDNEIVSVLNDNRECKLDKTDVRDEFGDLLYTIYFVHDITKQQEAFRIAQESRELAEEASRAKSNFLANMSHEIRTPMNAIVGMSDIVLEDTTLSEDIRTRVADIHDAGINLLGIINDILDISKIEAGRYELVTDEYDLPSLVNDISSIIDVRLYETRVKFNINIDRTLPVKLTGDVLRIRGILLNIIGNAVKFTKQGSITLDIKWNNDNSDSIIYFDVTDTGIGIKEDDIGLIFDKFSQVDTRKNRSIQGTGLGLAISRNLALLMGGDITVSSEYGKGSTFHISIKQEISNYCAIGNELASSLESRSYRNLSKKKEVEIVKRPNVKALIVDDTKVNLKVASHILQKYDMQIAMAQSGAEAIDMVQENDYDIVFMDHMMPEMDGVEATKHIRELGGKYADLVIVALTANATSEAKALFLSEGMQDFLPKPIDVKVLDEIINRWLPIV